MPDETDAIAPKVTLGSQYGELALSPGTRAKRNLPAYLVEP